MLSLHQLRCFLSAYEHGSLTAAADALGYAQPSVSEQIRTLERSVGAQLFTRVGRGVVPTGAAEEMRPHAERAVAAAEAARRAARRTVALETGTVRFGLFGTSRLYSAADLVSAVLAEHPQVRVELVGQNSVDVMEDLRRGRLEAAMIAVSQVTAAGMSIVPVARDELVYASADPERVATPVTAKRLSEASLVMAETTWAAVDATRVVIRRMLHETGRNPPTRIEVEDVETAVELMGRGLADTVVPRGVADVLLPRLAPRAAYVSLRPQQYDLIAIVHRAGATLSPAARLMIRLATERIRDVAEAVGPRDPLADLLGDPHDGTG